MANKIKPLKSKTNLERLLERLISNKNEILMLFLAVLTVSAFIELSYGSKYVGIIFFGLSVFVLLLVIKTAKVREASYTKSTAALLAGAILTIADIFYNYINNLEIQTFDSMVILLGISLILYGSGTRFAEIGRFGMYFTSIFLVLFLSLFVVPFKANIDLPYYYGQYIVTMPVVFLLNSLGLNVNIPQDRLIEVYGNHYALLKIDLACFGWYSILLVVSMIIAYNLTIGHHSWDRIAKIMVILVGASYFANLLRVLILVVVTYYYGIEKMLLIHAHIGWILFVAILLPLSHLFLKSSMSKNKN